ncbi:S53 family peptidase [Silvibacterium dinghuense]|uniref:Peptidase S53 n=1 Tax=Silvibacterium dinghuense TaxID=1560006 RepID=A0A4Q1SIZ3_9BACT|nr:S53 family peptidase [Silvibacterium dinghuense]RXS97220.1 peptidase S53 [Silvibacterium dinghuense]GGG97194.1 kumamolisin [Silvibacterium dinghuense]
MTNSSVKRVSLTHSERKAPHNASIVGPTPPQQIITVSVMVRRKNPLQLHELGGRHLSHEEFAEKYAASPADFDQIRSFAHQHGLTVDESASSLARRTIVLRGTAQAMQLAFGVTLHDYTTRTGHKFHGFTGTLSLPDEHASAIEAVLGLDARPIATPHFRVRQKAHGVAAAAAAGGDTSFNPNQVAAFYGFPNGTGAGQTVGIIELGGGYNTSDLNTYFNGLGITPPTIVAVSVDGGTNSTGSDADGEVDLDIQVVGSIATGAKIAVYFTTNTDQGFIDAITTAVHDTTNSPSVISISWGGPETSWAQSSLTALDSACQSAGALGVTITVAAGDGGSVDGTNSNVVDFPASSPYVLACGGTHISVSGNAIASEVVWNDGSNGGSTGGGVSTAFAVPTWQNGLQATTGSGAASALTGRGVPDVAGDASPASGYNVLVDGQQEVVGGTSAVAPLWAALIAIINQLKGSKAGFVNPTLYGATSAFNDITQGNNDISGGNGGYEATTGWDACTGLGSPKGTAIATALGVQ